jgi:hypothetical protein
LELVNVVETVTAGVLAFLLSHAVTAPAMLDLVVGQVQHLARDPFLLCGRFGQRSEVRRIVGTVLRPVDDQQVGPDLQLILRVMAFDLKFL